MVGVIERTGGTLGVALKSYQETQNQVTGNFKEALTEAVSTIKGGERASIRAAGGQVDVLAALTAVNEAETMLNFLTSVRDRMVQAVQEVYRTSI